MTRYIETANYYAEKRVGSTHWRSYRKNAEKKVVVGYANTINEMKKSLGRLEEKEAKLNENKETTVTLTAQELELMRKALMTAFCEMKEEDRHRDLMAFSRVDKKLTEAFEAIK